MGLLFFALVFFILAGALSSGLLTLDGVRPEAFRARNILRSPTYYLQTNEHALLQASFTFYGRLSAAGKKKFLYRTIRFRDHKYFQFHFTPSVPQSVPEILISAAAVQLTFGLKQYLLPKYRKIHVYEHSFLLGNGREAYGAASLGSAIALSWQPFLDGYRNGEDSWNLGIHEWGHALELSFLKEQSAGAEFARYYPEWKNEAEKVLQTVNEKETGFRNFPSEHFTEFLPVCLERLFESPQPFRDEFPSLFEHTKRLIRLDPFNAENDFRYQPQISQATDRI